MATITLSLERSNNLVRSTGGLQKSTSGLQKTS